MRSMDDWAHSAHCWDVIKFLWETAHFFCWVLLIRGCENIFFCFNISKVRSMTIEEKCKEFLLCFHVTFVRCMHISSLKHRKQSNLNLAMKIMKLFYSLIITFRKINQTLLKSLYWIILWANKRTKKIAMYFFRCTWDYSGFWYNKDWFRCSWCWPVLYLYCF